MNAAYQFYTTKELKPNGWLKQQLQLQRNGLSGALDQIWPDIRDSAWIGGNREGWERVPYWLDGAVPLAYLLEDESLIARVDKYVKAILSRQEPDGWLCPCESSERGSYDIWALFLISKALVVYYECTANELIPDVLYRAMKNLYELLTAKSLKLERWGKFRWFEGFIALNWLYERFPEPWIQKLAGILKQQGADYSEYTKEWIRPKNKWEFFTHIVNLTMMLKYEAISCDLLGEDYKNQAEEFYQFLSSHHGTAVGLFTGDECLSGLSPIQGTELCSVVEQMYSYEWLYAYTGDAIWAERLELLAFNALPATLSDDMWTHQYVQMSNQINCIPFPGRSLFRTNSSEAHLFGLEPNFGCCTANFSQGWPKFALSSWLHKDREIINAIPIPSILTTQLDGVLVKITLETDYPFRNEFIYQIETNAPVSMQLKLRIPSFAKNLMVNGQPSNSVKELNFDRIWQGITTLQISFDTVPQMKKRPFNFYCIEAGSLIFSLPIETEWIRKEYESEGVSRTYPYCDYELKGHSDWNFALTGQKLSLKRKHGDEIPFSSLHPRLVLETKVIPINWGLEDGFDTVCAKLPESLEPLGQPVVKEFYPYGCAKLRMTELPLI